MDENTFTTSRGCTVKFLPILADLETFGLTHKEPDAPTYEVKALAGVERHPLTQEIVDGPDSTDVEKQAWADYQIELAKANDKNGRDLIKLCILRGVQFDAPTAMDDWLAEQEFLGNPIPSSPLEKRYRYNYSMLVGSVGDVQQIIAGVARASGRIPEAVTAQAEETFPNPMGRAGRDTAESPADQGQGQLVPQPEIRTGGDGGSAGSSAERVRRTKRA